ncbi:unnamed protein product [Diatraea saccharalis]|uniref:Gustatory receptor n=1 Tax=Diatraea saccharalis TaxID=40085 RepID=A0A9N9WE76_9NEOP|nr:unnamed protein product [Diatraea saccharalis]
MTPSNEEVQCTVSGLSYFMFQMAKIFGIAPIKSEKNNNGYQISVSSTFCFINNTVITLFNVISVIGLIKDMILDSSESTRYSAGIRSLVWISELFGSIIIAGIAVYGGPTRTIEDIKIISRVQKTNRTNLLVGKLTIQCTDQLLYEELEKFYQYLTLNNVSYSPLGICTLSRCLIASIAGTVCTYLVIVFQFQVPDKGEY